MPRTLLYRRRSRLCGAAFHAAPRPGKVFLSQHLMHVDHDAVGMARAGSDEQIFYQPAVFFRTRFEFRHGAKIDQLWIDRLAALQSLQQLDRAEADDLVFDIDHGAVVGLEGVSGLELDQFVGPDDLEISTEGKHLAVDLLAPHLAADDRNDTADAMADLAGSRHVTDPHGDREDVFGLELTRHA